MRKNSLRLTALLMCIAATADAGIFNNLFGKQQSARRIVRPYQHPTFGYHATRWRPFPGAYYPHEMVGLDGAYPAPLYAAPSSEYIRTTPTPPPAAINVPHHPAPYETPTATDAPAPPLPPTPVQPTPPSAKVRHPWTTPQPTATPFQPLQKTNFTRTAKPLPTVRPKKSR